MEVFIHRGSRSVNRTREKFHEDAPSGMGRVVAGGVFAQKSAIRESTHVVTEIIFRNLMADIRSKYRDWENIRAK